jgi:hypothetical protein
MDAGLNGCGEIIVSSAEKTGNCDDVIVKNNEEEAHPFNVTYPAIFANGRIFAPDFSPSR